ncbi:MAG: response regulator [Bacteroidetes bacterium]|nr:response regulator [Bacteroidota bacterium]
MNQLTYIDDRQLDHFILKKTLSRFGSSYEVKCTSTGAAVQYLLSQYKLDSEKLPDIILIDIYMRDFDAWAFLDDLQAIYPMLVKPVEVYVLSASRYAADVERLKQYGFVKAFILKPITREVLEMLIKQKETHMDRFRILEVQN